MVEKERKIMTIIVEEGDGRSKEGGRTHGLVGGGSQCPDGCPSEGVRRRETRGSDGKRHGVSDGERHEVSDGETPEFDRGPGCSCCPGVRFNSENWKVKPEGDCRCLYVFKAPV